MYIIILSVKPCRLFTRMSVIIPTKNITAFCWGDRSHRLYLFFRVKLIARRLRRSIKGMPTGPRIFIPISHGSSADVSHFNMALYRILVVVGYRIITSKEHCVTIIIFINPSARAGYDTRSFFKRSLTGLNSEFSFSKTSCLTKAEEPSLPYNLPIAGGIIIGFIPFPRVCEMQSVSSRIWTHVTVSISDNDNHYTTDTIIILNNTMGENKGVLCWLESENH